MMKKFTPAWLRRSAGAALGLLILLLALAPLSALAENSVPGFTVRAILPENQIEPLSYFSLLAAPGSTQVIEVEVENHLGTPLILEPRVTGADSGAGGLIIYQDAPAGQRPRHALPELLSLDLSRLSPGEDGAILDISPEGRLTLAPGSTARIPFLLRLPEEALAGHVLGGILLTKVEDTARETVSFSVRSVYSYTIAVQLQSERTVRLPDDFTLTGVTHSQVAGFPALVVGLTNQADKVVAGAEIDLRVLPAGGGEAVLTHSQQRFSMAPHSHMPYTLPLSGGQTLAPGSYRLEIGITHGGKTTNLETTFEM